jgi:hypothetical protein
VGILWHDFGVCSCTDGCAWWYADGGWMLAPQASVELLRRHQKEVVIEKKIESYISTRHTSISLSRCVRETSDGTTTVSLPSAGWVSLAFALFWV